MITKAKKMVTPAHSDEILTEELSYIGMTKIELGKKFGVPEKHLKKMAVKLNESNLELRRNFLHEMQSVAQMTLQEDNVSVKITNELLGAETECVYVWVTKSEEWLRVGTAGRKTLEWRLLSYAKDISRALNGDTRYTPHWEALCWKKIIERNGPLLAFAYQPSVVETIVGPIRPYLDIERVLIGDKKPRLNRSHR